MMIWELLATTLTILLILCICCNLVSYSTLLQMILSYLSIIFGSAIGQTY